LATVEAVNQGGRPITAATSPLQNHLHRISKPFASRHGMRWQNSKLPNVHYVKFKLASA
jgi:hypothetical protein